MSSFTYQLYALTIEAHGEAKAISSKKLFRYDALNIKLVSLIRHDKFCNIIIPILHQFKKFPIKREIVNYILKW